LPDGAIVGLQAAEQHQDQDDAEGHAEKPKDDGHGFSP
jgi:hypothetical protein